MELLQPIIGAVTATIIHKDDFIGTSVSDQYSCQALGKQSNVVLLVMNGDHDR